MWSRRATTSSPTNRFTGMYRTRSAWRQAACPRAQAKKVLLTPAGLLMSTSGWPVAQPVESHVGGRGQGSCARWARHEVGGGEMMEAETLPDLSSA